MFADFARIYCDVKSIDNCCPCRGREERCQHFDGSAFACSIGTEQAEDGAAFDRKGDTIYGNVSVITVGEIDDFYCMHSLGLKQCNRKCQEEEQREDNKGNKGSDDKSYQGLYFSVVLVVPVVPVVPFVFLTLGELEALTCTSVAVFLTFSLT